MGDGSVDADKRTFRDICVIEPEHTGRTTAMKRGIAGPPPALPTPEQDRQAGGAMICHARHRRHEVARKERGPAAVRIELSPAQLREGADEQDGAIVGRPIGYGWQQSPGTS